MLSNQELYDIMDKLGMINLEDKCCDERDIRSQAEQFVQDTCSDLCRIINFVDDIAIWNDLETIKKFLTVLFFYNNLRSIVSSDGTDGGWIDYGNFSERIGK